MTALEQMDKSPLKSKKFIFSMFSMLAMVGISVGTASLACVVSPAPDWSGLGVFVLAALGPVASLAAGYVGFVSSQEAKVRAKAVEKGA